MDQVIDSLRGIESFFGAKGSGFEGDEAVKSLRFQSSVSGNVDISLECSLEKITTSFVLKEVVGAVVKFLKGAFSKIKIEFVNLCSESFSLLGDEEQLQKLLKTAVIGLGRSCGALTGTVAIIIHELRRPSDGEFLAKLFFENLPSQERGGFCKELCKRYVAISVKKKFEISGEPQFKIHEQKQNKEEISYFDGGCMVTNSASYATIFLLK